MARTSADSSFLIYNILNEEAEENISIIVDKNN